MRLLISALIVTTSVACSSMLVGGGSPSGGQLGADKRSAEQVSSDNAITATIRSRYAADSGISRFKLGVETFDGTVSLSGTVDSFELRDRALRIASRTDGVRNVRNDISVDSGR